MKRPSILLLLGLAIMASGCGKAIVNQPKVMIEKPLGETPPQPIIKAGGKALTVYQSSYCWKGTCADYVSPDQMLKDKKKQQVKANIQITYKFDVKDPDQITLTRFHNHSRTQERLIGNTFRTPQDKGIYYYNLSAFWFKDKDNRISEGSSDYTFAIEVIE